MMAGEVYAPGAVFQTIHALLTRYIDFRSEVESRILALGTMGTYFYTLFPAYPYLASQEQRQERREGHAAALATIQMR